MEGLGHIVHVACGQNHNLAVSASGHVFSWGATEDGQPSNRPRRVLAVCNIWIMDGYWIPSILIMCISLTCSKVPMPLKVPVIQVACGKSHSVALTKGATCIFFFFLLKSSRLHGIFRLTMCNFEVAQIPTLN